MKKATNLRYGAEGHKMKTYTIPAKMSGTGSIHDLASQHHDRVISFPDGAKYAVVLADFYGGKGYTTHKSEKSTVKKYRELQEYSLAVMDSDGNRFDVRNGELVQW